ncbi:MAG: nucleotide exchange factor GrpE [Chloroflexi bacterium]|nr:nucleotide exchange factor GrpE [Chloroflexota bacterium]
MDAVDARPSALMERLDAIERGLAGVARRLPSPQEGQATPSGAVTPDEVAPALAALEKSVSRAGREQFKTLALVQTQQEQLGAALDALRVADARREEELAAWPARAQRARDAARLEVAQALFPALDGLAEALNSGQRLLDQPAAPPPASFLDRLFLRRREEDVRGSEDAALREAMAAWLTGLTFIKQRLLDVLAAEGVRPIAALGQPFDPHYHVAVDVAPAGEGLAPGMVAAESRRGYVAGDRVLRYAEVTVAADAPPISR